MYFKQKLWPLIGYMFYTFAHSFHIELLLKNWLNLTIMFMV
jgi:hypothetical protein